MLQYGRQIFVLQSVWLAGIYQILDHFIVYRSIYTQEFSENERLYIYTIVRI